MYKQLFTFILVLTLATAANAREFRQFNAINTPEKLPENATPMKVIEPIDRKVIEAGVEKIIGSWNTNKLQENLAENFYEAERLDDAISTYIPRDAKLRILSVRGQQTLQQYQLEGERVSRVSVTVNTQLEYNSPQAGFQTRQGTSEMILKITEKVGGGL